MPITIATFYYFAAVPDARTLQTSWKQTMLAEGVRGTILLAPEGINATIAGPEKSVQAMLAFIRSDPRFAALTHKTSHAATNPFQRAKVRLKRETIPLGVPVNPAQAGTYVAPEDWNTLISNPNTIVVDTRNDYEVKIGRFRGARNPKTDTFKQLPAWLDKNLPDKSAPIAMYCTGGIRCEKSTAYLKARGYRNVYHLKGGILQYLQDIPQEESLWQGACYVFDDRVAVRHDLTPASGYQSCKTCNNPIVAADHRRAPAAPQGQANPCPWCNRA